MRRCVMAVATVLAVVACFPHVSFGQCEGLAHAGQLGGEGSYNSNLVGYGEVLLPPNVKLDTSFHQAKLGAVANGKSSAYSHLVVSQVPAGICIVPSGDNSANHGWAVGDGSSPVIELVPAVWDASKNTISQYKFRIRLYCTTGSGLPDATTGGCNAKVDVFYKPLKAAAKKPAKK